MFLLNPPRMAAMFPSDGSRPFQCAMPEIMRLISSQFCPTPLLLCFTRVGTLLCDARPEPLSAFLSYFKRFMQVVGLFQQQASLGSGSLGGLHEFFEGFFLFRHSKIEPLTYLFHLLGSFFFGPLSFALAAL